MKYSIVLLWIVYAGKEFQISLILFIKEEVFGFVQSKMLTNDI